MTAAAQYFAITDFMQYDGTNGTEMATYMGAHVVTDTGTQLQVSFEPVSHEVAFTFQLGDWFSNSMGPCLEENFAKGWLSIASMTPNDGEPGPTGPAGYFAGKSAQIPAVALLSTGTRELAVSWGRTLPNDTYEVDFLTDNTLTVGTPYVFAVKSGSRTTTGFTLQYTNSALLTLGSGIIHCLARAA